MGYSNYFTFQPGSTQYADVWPAIVISTRTILDAMPSLGVEVCGPDGLGEPIVHPASGIEFNGNAAQRAAYADSLTPMAIDALVIPPPHQVAPDVPPDCRVFRHVKTLALPYDLAVAAVLLRAHQLAGGIFIIGSDGEWDEDWIQPAGANPRDLLRQLFHTTINRDPLVDVTQGMAIGDTGWIDPRLVDNPRIP